MKQQEVDVKAKIALQYYANGELQLAYAACEEILSAATVTTTNNLIALQLKPIVMFKLGLCDEALAAMNGVVEALPNSAECHYSLSLMQLWFGNFSDAWRSYEWRIGIESFGIPKPKIKRWTGEYIDSKHILVLVEQGFGDCIQFARYLPLIKQRCQTLTFACFKPLLPLFDSPIAKSCIDHLVTNVNDATQFDCYVTLGSLPRIFSTNESYAPPPFAFQNQRTKPSVFRKDFATDVTDGKLKIGIAWSGRPENENDQFRSMPITPLLEAFRNTEAKLYSLQLHESIADDLIPNEVEFVQSGLAIKTFADTAELIDQMDIVITVDTVIAHLALSMGADTTVLLCTPEDWRWVTYDGVCPWYPKAKLLKQECVGEWQSVLERLENNLKENVQK